MSFCKPNEIENHGVLIQIPSIYVSAEDLEDKAIPNLKVLPYNQLVEFAQMAKSIPTMTVDESTEFGHTLIDKIITNSKNKDLQQIGPLLDMVIKCALQLSTKDEYFDMNMQPISFDVIRKYTTENGLLKTAEPTTYHGFSFYSQLSPKDVELAKKENNDSDYNRIQYTFSILERMLLFQKGYLVDNILKIINLSLLYTLMSSVAIGVEGYCAIDLECRLLGHLCDVIIRTRLLQAWINDENCKTLLTDIRKNYPPTHYLNIFSQIPTAKGRINKLCQLAKETNMRPILDNFSYERYMQVLEQSKLEILEGNYYNPRQEYILGIIEMLPPTHKIVEICNEIKLV